jgi:hypothetical protein
MLNLDRYDELSNPSVLHTKMLLCLNTRHKIGAARLLSDSDWPTELLQGMDILSRLTRRESEMAVCWRVALNVCLGSDGEMTNPVGRSRPAEK